MPDNVALLCEYPTLLGGERSWLATLGPLRDAGFCPIVIAPPAGRWAEALVSAGIQHIPWTVFDRQGGRRDLAILRTELRELVNELRPKLVHANSLSMARLAGPVLRDVKTPGIGHLRDIVRLSATAACDVNRLDRLLAVSEATRSFHIAQGIDAHRTHVLYNGVDLEEFGRRRSTTTIDRELGLSADSLVVAAIGQIGLRKGTDVFVELARCVLERRADAYFLVVGERTSSKAEAVLLEAAIREKSSVVPCRGRVRFLGTRDDIPDILERVDLVVHAARQEPLGRVLLESAAAAKAIVATDAGGTREIFPRESESAVLVPTCEVADIATSELLRATLWLLDDPIKRDALGHAARRRAEQQFDARNVGPRLAEHYREVLSG